MHLVFVSSLVPVANPASGFDIANRVVFDGLRMLGHKVSVIGYLQPGQSPAVVDETIVLRELEVTNSRVNAFTRLRWLVRSFTAGTTVSSAKMLAVPAARIETALESLEPFDGLVLNSVQLPAAFEQVFRRFPFIYVAHNVEFQSARENARMAAGRVKSALFKREARHLERLETELAKSAAWMWTFADADRYGFGPAIATRSSVLPLVTSTVASEPLSDCASTHDLGLIGTWSWQPNRIGLDWFLESVVPLLPHDMSIAIAGHFTQVPESSHPGVRFIGRVRDARAFVTESHVVPLISRSGSGIQLKTLEALELGIPCVATSASLRGIGRAPETCVIEDEPRAFADACIRMVEAARAGTLPRRSGRAFHSARMASLLEAMTDGLSHLSANARSAGVVRALKSVRPMMVSAEAPARAVAVRGART